jgi:hypothetical protein
MRVYRYWSYSIEKKMLIDLDTQEKKYKKIMEDIEENK